MSEAEASTTIAVDVESQKDSAAGIGPNNETSTTEEVQPAQNAQTPNGEEEEETFAQLAWGATVDSFWAVFGVLESIGEALADMFGLTQSRYQWAVDEYNRQEREKKRRKKEKEDRRKAKVDAMEAGTAVPEDPEDPTGGDRDEGDNDAAADN
eukprot:Rmarinus@m.9123